MSDIDPTDTTKPITFALIWCGRHQGYIGRGGWTTPTMLYANPLQAALFPEDEARLLVENSDAALELEVQSMPDLMTPADVSSEWQWGRDTSIRWSPINQQERLDWRGYFNNMEICGYSLRTEPDGSRYFGGVYAWFGNCRFTKLPATEAEVRVWLELKLREWLAKAGQAAASNPKLPSLLDDPRAGILNLEVGRHTIRFTWETLAHTRTVDVGPADKQLRTRQIIVWSENGPQPDIYLEHDDRPVSKAIRRALELVEARSHRSAGEQFANGAGFALGIDFDGVE